MYIERNKVHSVDGGNVFRRESDGFIRGCLPASEWSPYEGAIAEKLNLATSTWEEWARGYFNEDEGAWRWQQYADPQDEVASIFPNTWGLAVGDVLRISGVTP